MLESEVNSFKLDKLSVMKNYYGWVFDEFGPFMGKRVLEIGSGTGNFSRFIMEEKGLEKLYLLEPFDSLMENLTKLYKDNPKVDLIESKVENLSARDIETMDLDTVVFVNVLEHIADDCGVLRLFASALKPGSKILTFSPAFSLLYSQIDLNAGHIRRYTKKSIKNTIEKADCSVIYMRYFNFIGFFSWLLLVKFLRAEEFSLSGLKLFDSLVPYMRQAEKIISPPLGQNVIAIAEVN